MALVQRHQLGTVIDDLRDAPIGVIVGARQVGKSTLAAGVVAARDGELRTLDDPTLLAAARLDPIAFLEHQLPLLAIDEVQRAPELVLPLKLLVDRDQRPGRYLVTGSSDLLHVPGAADSLAGRTASTRLRGFSQGELSGNRERFVDRCFAGDRFTDIVSDLTRDDYARRICLGGYPASVRADSDRARRRFFDDYTDRVLVRSTAEIASVEDPDRLPRLMRLLSGQTSAELNRADLARHIGTAAATIDRMLGLLRTMFLVEVLPAWSRNLTERAVRRPKVFVSDTGLVANLMGLDPDALSATSASRAIGPMFETFVVTELLKQAEWSDVQPAFSHFRDHNGAEVDLVMESRQGAVVAIEVKATRTINAGHTRWLEALGDRLGSAFLHGYVLYTGDRAVPFGPRVTAVPIEALWSA